MRKLLIALLISFAYFANAQNTNTYNSKHDGQSVKNNSISVMEFCSEYGGPYPVDTTYYSDGRFSVLFSPDMRICVRNINGEGILFRNRKLFLGPRSEIIEAFNPGVRQGSNPKIVIIDSFGGGCFGVPTTTYALWEKGRWVVTKKINDNSYSIWGTYSN